MAKMVDRVCWCGTHFQARQSDVNRGWAKCCCKSHAAIAREQQTGAYKRYLEARGDGDEIDWEGGGWDAHKGTF